MGFQVGFIPDIQAQLVADLVKKRVVGIVAGAHGVEIMSFHHQGVGQHLIIGHIFAVCFGVIVAVGPFDVDHFAIDQKFPVFDLDFTETDPV